MNKRGEFSKQITVLAFFFLLAIIAVGISFGVALFFGGEYDFRGVDSSALAYKIEKCLLENEKIIDIFADCGINKNVLENSNVIFAVCLNKERDECVLGENFLYSSGSGFSNCMFSGAEENKAFPKCTTREFYINGIRYRIITGSNQHIRRSSI